MLASTNMQDDPASLEAAFRSTFGLGTGSPAIPGNVGESRDLFALLRGILKQTGEAVLNDLENWSHPIRLVDVERCLVHMGQLEAAWALAHLEHDQRLKREARSSMIAAGKGGALCSLALVAERMGSHSLTRHFAELATAGDVYSEVQQSELAKGGLAATILGRYESYDSIERWRSTVREKLTMLRVGQGEATPFHVEALLPQRWFDQRADQVLELAKVAAGVPFPDLLLDAVVADQFKKKPKVQGTLLEAAVGLLLGRTPGFRVHSSRRTSDEETDLVVSYSRSDPLSWLELPVGPGLVECKSGIGKIRSSVLREFGARCLFHQVGFGILVARTGITGAGPARLAEPSAGELVRRRLLLEGVTVLVLDVAAIHGRATDLRGLQEPLIQDHERLVFGPLA